MNKYATDTNKIGNVIRILDEYSILVNCGSKDLREGMLIQVYTPVEMITDIDGTPLGYYNYIKDTLKVISCETNFSLCRKYERSEKPIFFALSPLLEERIPESAPLNINETDIQPLPSIYPSIKVGDPIKLA